MAYDVQNLPIGVFDSGVGGLTVLRALREAMPRESFIYLGDTARLPYGTKSPATVERYARQAAQILVDRGVKLLVIACNTASAVAVEALRGHFAPLPLVGVVEPGARAACAASATGRILVIGTESTIRGGAYDRAITALRPDAEVVGHPCPLFVGLAEEGWFEGDVVEAAAERYLAPFFAGPESPDCLVLGCTHFPVLKDALRRSVGQRVAIVDSAETTAMVVSALLAAQGLETASARGAAIRFLATDGPERFARVGSRFLSEPLRPADVELVDL